MPPFPAPFIRLANALLLAALLVTHAQTAAPAQAQAPNPAQVPAVAAGTVPERGPITAHLLTMGQGDVYWTRFGHNALRIVDHQRGTDISYNWGLFDFDEPGFLARFIRGDTRYWMAGFDTWQMLEVYRAENRTIEMQELALPAAAARALQDFVEWNARPENRTYRYDYYRDNCSTRIRDALDHALGGQLRAATDTIVTPRTYRWHTSRLLAEQIPAYAGTMAALGQPTDRPITAWEEMFIPMEMRDWVRTISIGDGAGGSLSLVQSETLLFATTRPAEREDAPDRRLPIALIALLAATLIVAGSSPAARRRIPGSGVIAATVAAAWGVAAGIAGVTILGFWLFTAHEATYYNENALQLTPLSLALAMLLPLVLRDRPGRSLARAGWILALIVLGLSALGLLAKLLPTMIQTNGEVVALALPLHAAVVYALWSFRRSTPASLSASREPPAEP